MTKPADARRQPAPLRVASIPGAHPYVRGLGLDAPAVRLLDDPPVPGAPEGQWWPPVMLDADWIAEHRGDFDLMHLHFGAESLTLEQLDEAVAALHAAGRPLVYTAHDLSHPQLSDQAHQRAQLDRLIPAADGLITLTRAAACEIERRWGLRAQVIAHPAIAAAPGAAPIGIPKSREVRIGVHLRDLRPNIDGAGSVRTLLEALSLLADDEVLAWFGLHPRVRDERQREEIRRLCADHPRAVFDEAPRATDPQLEAQLDELSAAVLPYRHGTHSGWLELCWDLGVPVAAPDLGGLSDQHPGDDLIAVFTPGDAESLAAALRRLLAAPEARPGSAARRTRRARRRRLRERDARAIRRAHLDHYARVLDRSTLLPSGPPHV